ncbi:prephenate dehydrogenase [Maridesulfovibrio ferrireducens]|uniref:Prephenate dehydrogenase n=2 Tax=Maridesulfovibrio ferrireducens TaxID=246191 RepID=A0A1G9J581_9BACT|nr:prephenate dehydrogenase [Maridesulfovibrio ferrireducens]
MVANMESDFSRIHSIAVIGSRGQMGGFLALKAERAGILVHRFDQPLDEKEMARLLPGTDFVLLCIPVTVMDEVLTKVVPHMKKGSILSDVGSVKGRPLQQMVRAYDGPVVGTHPLFGSTIPVDFDPTVALVAGREEDSGALESVKDFYERLGFGAFASTEEEHDRAMAMIQSLNFSSTIAFLACARELPNIEKYVTPSFKRRLESAQKMVTQDSDLFVTISDANQYSLEAIRLFRSFLSLAASGDMDLLSERASWWWRDNHT